jgi:carbon starvation protein
MARQEWIPGSIFSTLLVVVAWAYFIWTGSISTIWPMFGIANQLLAALALAVATTIIINTGKARYMWVTVVPLAFVSITTLTAGVLSVRNNFWPMAIGPDVTRNFQGWINTSLTIIMMVCVVVILANALWKWQRVLSGRQAIEVGV